MFIPPSGNESAVISYGIVIVKVMLFLIKMNLLQLI